MDELEALKAALSSKEEASVEDPTIEAKGFYVIIGSFPSQEGAETLHFRARLEVRRKLCTRLEHLPRSLQCPQKLS